MPAKAKGRVLVVDDNRVNRRLLEASLFREGYEAHCAEGGKECLKLLGGVEDPSEAFDMVLLDIMMPDIDGLEVLGKIRETRSRIELPVIMVTSKDESEDVIEALESGANDYVTKPIDFPVLLVRMETHIALRQSHKDLRDSHRSLVEAAKLESVGYLAAGVAHEIRNPLAQIQMGLEGVQHVAGGDGNEVVEGVFANMFKAIENADRIVSGLMNYSTEKRLKLEPHKVNAVTDEALMLLDESLAEAGIDVVRAFDDEDPVGLLEPEEIKRVLRNVILNAIHAMPEGGTLTVRTGDEVIETVENTEGSRSSVKLRQGEKATAIVIEDTGPGMSEEDLQRIYDPFFTSKATGKGSGLGMTVARKIMDLHGGMIRVGNRKDGNGLSVALLLRKKAGLMI